MQNTLLKAHSCTHLHNLAADDIHGNSCCWGKPSCFLRGTFLDLSSPPSDPAPPCPPLASSTHEQGGVRGAAVHTRLSPLGGVGQEGCWGHSQWPGRGRSAQARKVTSASSTATLWFQMVPLLDKTPGTLRLSDSSEENGWEFSSIPSNIIFTAFP
jgi:hypothetical protein